MDDQAELDRMTFDFVVEGRDGDPPRGATEPEHTLKSLLSPFEVLTGELVPPTSSLVVQNHPFQLISIFNPYRIWYGFCLQRQLNRVGEGDRQPPRRFAPAHLGEFVVRNGVGSMENEGHWSVKRPVALAPLVRHILGLEEGVTFPNSIVQTEEFLLRANFSTIAAVTGLYGSCFQLDGSNSSKYLRKWTWRVGEDRLKENHPRWEVFNQSLGNIAQGMWKLVSSKEEDEWARGHERSQLSGEMRVAMSIPEDVRMGFGDITISMYHSRGHLIMDEIKYSGHYGQVESRHMLVLNLKCNKISGPQKIGYFQMVLEFDVLEDDPNALFSDEELNSN